MTTPHFAPPAGTGARTILSALADTARRVQRSASGLTRAEREFCRDVARAKYPARWLERLAKLAARCTSDEDRHALDENVRDFIVAERVHAVPMSVRPLSVAEAGERETIAQGQLDLAQYAYLRHRSEATYAAVLEASTRQMEATRHLADAVSAERTKRGPLALVR